MAGSGSSIESVTAPGENGTLPPGTYELSVRSEHGIAATSDNATVTVKRRSTNGLTTYTGTEADRSDLANATAVRDAIEGDTLSRSQSVAANDTVVYAANASGLTGLTAARSAGLETGDDLGRLDGLEFGVRSTASDEAATASDSTAGLPRDSAVHVDESGLYVVADGKDALPTDGEPEPGEEFTAEFRVTDDRLREAASDPPDGHRATSTVTFDGRSPGGPAGDDRERIAPGDPADGGTGAGGSGGTGGAGGSAGGTAPTGPAGDRGPGGPDAGEAGRPGGGGDRIDPAAGVGGGVGFRPSAERRTPHPGAPIAVSGRTPVGDTGGPERAGATEPDAWSDDETGARNDGGSPASGEAGDEADGTRAGDAERATPTYENAPIRTTAEDVPGFGLLHSLTAVAVAVLAMARWRRER
ncbi:hypothetical protein CK500_06870 [Halorubrum salipaludis]|uniref:PGF-CTERM sorting domain-containing protein n=1 Tax=Halorubrum salipaludis TaxID=2032630 RepID=A0A2A2FHS9_9EURY|nr:hypothetical protein CK500_06870 [Halorubrum salipaludis]